MRLLKRDLSHYPLLWRRGPPSRIFHPDGSGWRFSSACSQRSSGLSPICSAASPAAQSIPNRAPFYVDLIGMIGLWPAP